MSLVKNLTGLGDLLGLNQGSLIKVNNLPTHNESKFLQDP